MSCFIHISKHYPPLEITSHSTFSNLSEYFCNLPYAHCGQKALALDMLLEQFGIESHVINYSDLNGWAHGFVEVYIDEKWQILDPTFNLYFNIGVQEIIQNPDCKRKVLSFYSKEFYVDDSQDYEEFMQTLINSVDRTTFKYNREWFMLIGIGGTYYKDVAPILSLTQVKNGQSVKLYDIRADSRFKFI